MAEENLLVICNNFPNQDNSFVGGVFVKEQVKYLGHRFDNVYVVSPKAYGMGYLRGTKHNDYQFDNAQVFFPRYINNPLFWYYGRSMWVELEARAISSLIKKEHQHFDLIHAHYTWPSGAVAVELKKRLQVPVVITEHTSMTILKFLDKKDTIAIQTWRNADAIIRVNKLDIGRICEVAEIPASSVHYIPNGYDKDKFYPMNAIDCRKKLGLPSDKKIILNVGNPYSRVKGHQELINAFAYIAKNDPNVICVIVGDGQLRDTLISQISAHHLEDRMVFVGKKPHQDIPLWMNACDSPPTP